MNEPDFERTVSRVSELGADQSRPWRIDEPPWATPENKDFIMPVGDQALSCIRAAREVQPLAESHRGFNVGACATIRREGRIRATSHGVNMKNAPEEASVDLHAEQLIVRALRDEDMVTTLAIVGQPHEDHGSGLTPETLHPCSYRCQPLLAESPHVDAQTIIVCSTVDVTTLQWGTVDDFISYHQGDFGGVQTARFDGVPDMFDSQLEEDHFYDIDGGEWDSVFRNPFIQWAHDRGIVHQVKTDSSPRLHLPD